MMREKELIIKMTNVKFLMSKQKVGNVEVGKGVKIATPSTPSINSGHVRSGSQ